MTAKTELTQLLKQQIFDAKLYCKWIPREKSSKKDLAIELRQFFKMSPKQYRKTIAGMSETVEDLMCAQAWDTINFDHVPSVAAARYQKAFNKNAPVEYAAYKAGLVAGTAKINASAIHVHDIVKSLKMGDKDVAVAQWEALPNFMTGGNILPVCDVSGSMSCSVGGNKNLTCMDISIALGLYCADKNTGPFKDCVLTFSENSKIQVLKGNLAEKYNQLQRMEWGMSTSLSSAYDAILKVALENHLSEEDMPKYLLILSDMSFDQSCHSWKESAQQMVERKFAEAGYQTPAIIYWNLNDNGSVPVKFDKKGTCLVSGYSTSILESILSAEDMSPYSIMLKTINSDRYNIDLS